MAVRHYNPRDIIITFAGIIFEGYADGEFVSIEAPEDAFSLYIGADGHGVRAATNNFAGTVTATLSQASKTNELLSALHALDRASGEGVGPLSIKDLNGTSLYAAATAWIKKQPTAGFAKTVGTRAWVIETDILVPFHGSSGSPGAL